MTSTSIYDLSWDSDSFLAKMRLFFQSQKTERLKMSSSSIVVQAEGYSALSSTYYSIVGTTGAKLRTSIGSWFAPIKIPLWCFTWAPLAIWCAIRMLPLSNRVVALIGYNGMSADQCDIRQSILRFFGRFDEAEICIKKALKKDIKEIHTRGLLHAGLAQVYMRKGLDYIVEDHMLVATSSAQMIEINIPRQASRIYRQCAQIADYLKVKNPERQYSGDFFLKKARMLAEQVGSKDQILKTG